ncbi:MAG TPA: histidine kinase [Flavobacteriales bacterium]|nr:histidine kinase [Flavobacteriales bacterium]
MKITKHTAYWILQLSGWLLFVAFIALFNKLQGNPFTTELWLNLAVIFLLGVGLTHFFRFILLKFNWLQGKFWQRLPKIIMVTLLLATVFHFVQYFISDVLISKEKIAFSLSETLLRILNWALLLFFWEAIYFVYHFVENSRREEIKNLRWEAVKNEMELNKLKSQLNPHFLFNAMNTIRALIDENPQTAKKAVTNLAHILRSSLQFGKLQLIPLDQELKIVDDYLQIEKLRFEEKLDFEIKNNIAVSSVKIPPMMLQTLVENAIKHGTAKRKEGGKITVSIDEYDSHSVKISIQNPGEFLVKNESENTKFGLENTKQRLKLIFGEKASLHIKTANGTVEVILIIPK